MQWLCCRVQLPSSRMDALVSITEHTQGNVCPNIAVPLCWLFHRATKASLLAQENHLALPAKHQGIQFQDRWGRHSIVGNNSKHYDM